MLPLLLASSSPYRRQLLERLGFPFQCYSPDIDESSQIDESPHDLVKRLAETKAQTAAHKYPHHLIIGSDQVACLEKQILTKPGNFEKAFQQLSQCSGRSVTFYTGLTLLNSATNKQQSIIEPFTVHFRALSPIEIERYLQTEKPYDCAGSFKVEGMGICLFEKLSGDDPNSLIGLPLIQLVNLLKKEGISLP